VLVGFDSQHGTVRDDTKLQKMRFLALYKRVGRHDRYREIGIVEGGDPLQAEQEAVSRLDDGQKRAWFESRVIMKLYNLSDFSNPQIDVMFQEDLNALRNETDQKWLEQMEAPEGGWPKGSDADRL